MTIPSLPATEPDASAAETGRPHNDNQKARARAELLYELAAAANSAERIEQVFDVALDGIERALGASRSSILVFDREGVMRFRSWRGLSEEYRRAVEGHSPWKKDTRAAEPILVSDARRDETMSPYRALFDREGIGALAFVPLLATGRLVGKFMVYYDRPRSLPRQELETAKAIANLVATAIARFEMIAELRETVRYNELFAGILAHDLRNPLGAMLMSAELVLRLAEGEGDRTKPLGRIISSGQRMARMVDQLLDFTRARVGGGFRLQPRATHLGELCRQVVEELEVGNPEWTIRLEESGDLRGTWDLDRLTQVASNLVANAGQHGTAGGEIRIRADGNRPDQVVLQVRNSGSIPESLRASLFDPFRRVRDRADTRRGLGLGLFISRELVVSHGGSVEVSSLETDGTTFTVRLPRHSPLASRTDLG